MKLARDLLVPYQEGEAPWSYCSRIASRIGITAKAFARHAGTSLKAIVYGEGDALSLLSEAAQIDVSTLRSHSPVKITSGRTLLRGEVLTGGLVTRSKLRFCPICLASQNTDIGKPYILTDWAVSPITVCVKHNVEIQTLTDVNSHAWDTVPLLDHVRRTLERRPVIEKFPAAFELHLMSRLHGNPDESWLSRIPFYAVVELSIAVGVSERFEIHTTRTSMGPQETHEAACMGFEILDGGEESIQQYLAVRDYLKTKQIGPVGPVGPYSVYGHLYSFLTRRRNDQSFDYIRSVIQDHFLKNYPHGNSIFGRPINNRKVQSLLSLARQTGLSDKKLRNLVANDGYIEYAVKGTSRDKILLPTDVADDLLSRNADKCSIRQLILVLGSTERQAKAIVQSGLVPLVLRRGATTGYSRSAAVELRERVVKAASLGETSNSALVPISSHGLRIIASEVEIIQLLIKGRLKHVGLSDGNSALKSLLVSKTEVAEVLQREVTGLTTAEVGQRLQLELITIHKLHQLGLLPKPSVRNPTGRRPAFLTALTDVVDFDRTYISLGKLSELLGMHSVKVYHRLRAAKVTPVATRSADVMAAYPDFN